MTLAAAQAQLLSCNLAVAFYSVGRIQNLDSSRSSHRLAGDTGGDFFAVAMHHVTLCNFNSMRHLLYANPCTFQPCYESWDDTVGLSVSQLLHALVETLVGPKLFF